MIGEFLTVLDDKKSESVLLITLSISLLVLHPIPRDILNDPFSPKMFLVPVAVLVAGFLLLEWYFLIDNFDYYIGGGWHSGPFIGYPMIVFCSIIVISYLSKNPDALSLNLLKNPNLYHVITLAAFSMVNIRRRRLKSDPAGASS